MCNYERSEVLPRQPQVAQDYLLAPLVGMTLIVYIKSRLGFDMLNEKLRFS
jgi:hypothetical protein